MQIKHFQREESRKAWEANFSNQFTDYRLKLKHFMTRHDGLDPLEDHEYCEHYFSQLIKGYQVTDIVIALDDHNEVIGFIWGNLGNIGRIHVPLAMRRKGIGSKMLEKYLEETKLRAEGYIASWADEDIPTVQFWTKHGFEVTSALELEASSLIRSQATRKGSLEFHQKRLDDNTDGYEDFRGGYVVIDGDYTLDQLESLVIVAREQLKSE